MIVHTVKLRHVFRNRGSVDSLHNFSVQSISSLENMWHADITMLMDTLYFIPSLLTDSLMLITQTN
jgi:hypothetical protein